MIDPKQVADFLIFHDIGAKDRGAILAGAQEVAYDAGAVILEEDEHGPDSDLFIIIDGRVEVLIASKQAARSGIGSHKQVAILDAGEVFGDIGLLNGHRRSAQIKAYSNVKVIKVNRERLFDRLEKRPQLGYRFMRNLASVLSDRLVDLNFLWRNET